MDKGETGCSGGANNCYVCPYVCPLHCAQLTHRTDLIYNTWFLGPTGVLNRNGISIGSAVFGGVTSVTDQPTNHATRSVTIGRI